MIGSVVDGEGYLKTFVIYTQSFLFFIARHFHFFGE